MLSMMNTPRIAVVTGANRGIGHEIARQLADRKIHVIGTSRSAAADDLRGVEWSRLDVTDREAIGALATKLAGGFDILVNNAGVSLRGFDAKVAEGTLATNFFGAVEVTQALLPLLRTGGRIVMISSGMGELSSFSPELRRRFEDAALTVDGLMALARSFIADVARGEHAERGWPTSAYGVSKAALNAYTRILARELRADPRGILVNAVCPGWVRTDMGGTAAPRTVEQGANTPVWLALLPPGGPSGGFFRDQRAIPW